MKLQGKTVLITGATDGLGRKVAQMAAEEGADLLLHGRDAKKGDALLAELKGAGAKGRLEFYRADLASLEEVRAMAREVLARHGRLDVLINNAGVALFGDKPREESRDGHELHFQVNYLAHVLLTEMLLAALRAGAPSRIVNVSSLGQAPIDFDDVHLKRSYSGTQGYCQSKLAQIMFTIELAERLKGSGVTAMALHPGTFMNTNMVIGQGLQAQSRVEDGAEAVYRLAFSPEHEGESGGFYNQFQPGQPNAQAADPAARKRLWDLSARLTGA
jgi:NAD(P)-dependent dehydrogenase (short-subunit alcohol dehydrogenase family)